MTRRGKIARLPRSIREELNRRLEDGEQGTRLVEWLNGLPEVVAVLKADFEGQAINESNLTLWRNGGFLDWQAQQKALSLLEEWRVESPMSKVQSPMSGDAVGSPMSNVQGPKSGNAAMSQEVAGAMAERLVVHYAAALEDAIDGTDEKARKHLERLGQSLREVVRVQRFGLAKERAQDRAEVEREWLALERERLELMRTRLNRQAAPESNKATEAEQKPALSHDQKAEMVRKMLEEL